MSLPGSQGPANSSGQIPVNVSDLTNLEVTAYQFVITYDPLVIEITDVDVAGTLSQGKEALINTAVAGQISVSSASALGFTGSGVLLNLQVNYLAPGNTSLTFDSFMFNEGTPSASTTNGSVTVTGGDGSGAVSVTVPNTSGSSGTGILVPLNVGDLSGKNVTSFEVTLAYDSSILQIVDIAQEGTLSAGVAPIVNTGTEGKVIISWAGVTPLQGAGVLFNFEATLLNDGVSPLTLESFTFNEGDPGAILTSGSVTVSDTSSNLEVSMPDTITGERNTPVQIPVITEDISGESVTSFAFTVTFNSSIVEITGVSTAGTLTDGRTVTINTDTPGQVIVAYSGGTTIQGVGTLVNLAAQLKAPGSTALSFASFQYNNGNPPVDLNNGRVTVAGQATYLQVVHNSSDAPSFDIYINDQKQVESLNYSGATPFLVLETFAVNIDVVAAGAADNSSPIASLNVVLENGKDYVAVINGLYGGSGKQALGVVLQESQQEANNEDTVGIVMFQGSPDAPPVNAYIVDDSGNYNRILTLAKGLSFGDSFLTSEFEPGIYNIELTQNNGPRIGIYRADLTRTGGASFLFMIQGFVNPLLGQPNLAMTAYSQNGQGVLLPITVTVSNEDDFELPDAFTIHGNYPNPFNPTTSIQFDLPEPATVHIEVYDLSGRNVMQIPGQQYSAGDSHIAQINASELASGTYLYRLIAQGAHQTFVQSSTMTLLK